MFQLKKTLTETFVYVSPLKEVTIWGIFLKPVAWTWFLYKVHHRGTIWCVFRVKYNLSFFYFFFLLHPPKNFFQEKKRKSFPVKPKSLLFLFASINNETLPIFTLTIVTIKDFIMQIGFSIIKIIFIHSLRHLLH